MSPGSTVNFPWLLTRTERFLVLLVGLSLGLPTNAVVFTQPSLFCLARKATMSLGMRLFSTDTLKVTWRRKSLGITAGPTSFVVTGGWPCRRNTSDRSGCVTSLEKCFHTPIFAFRADLARPVRV